MFQTYMSRRYIMNNFDPAPAVATTESVVSAHIVSVTTSTVPGRPAEAVLGWGRVREQLYHVT